MRREQIESMMNNTDLMDVQLLESSMCFYQRNKVSNQKRQSSTGEIQYPNLTELMTHEQGHAFASSSGANTYTRNIVTMLHDTYFVVTQLWYDHSNRAQRRRLPFQTNDRLTLGLGLFYERTNYTIEEDESYYYVTCDFDLYLDTRILESQIRGVEGDRYALIAPGSGRRVPLYPERDEQLHTLQTNLAADIEEAVGNAGNRRGGRIPFSYIDHKSVDDFLSTRHPHMKARARSRTHIPSAARSCIAISKTFRPLDTHEIRNQEAVAQSLLRSNEIIGAAPPSWFEPTNLTRYLRNNAVADESGIIFDPRIPEQAENLESRGHYKYGIRTNQKQSYYGNSTHWKKRDNLFLGIKGNSDKFMFARLISTRENPGNLASLMRSKMQEQNYPETNTMNLLSDDAMIDTYDSFEEVPAEMFGNLSLVRTGDCTTVGGGQILLDYCTNIDGVYTLNVQRNIMLRKGTSKMILYGGQYRLCIPRDRYDVIQYTNLVATTLEEIEVEEIRERLSFGSAATDLVVETKIKSRQISFGNEDVGEPTFMRGRGRLQLNSLSEEE